LPLEALDVPAVCLIVSVTVITAEVSEDFKLVVYLVN